MQPWLPPPAVKPSETLTPRSRQAPCLLRTRGVERRFASWVGRESLQQAQSLHRCSSRAPSFWAPLRAAQSQTHKEQPRKRPPPPPSPPPPPPPPGSALPRPLPALLPPTCRFSNGCRHRAAGRRIALQRRAGSHGYWSRVRSPSAAALALAAAAAAAIVAAAAAAAS